MTPNSYQTAGLTKGFVLFLLPYICRDSQDRSQMMLTRERAVSPAAGQLGRGGREVQLSAEPGRCALAQRRPLHVPAMQSRHLFSKWIFVVK
jgi:hypothetical protein